MLLPALSCLALALAEPAHDGAESRPHRGGTLRTERAFRTAVEPRLDPLFPGPGAVQADLEAFATTQGEMRVRRDEFSVAVHETLAALPARRGGAACPADARRAYQRAHAAGATFLALGHRLRELNRRIGRAEALGETAALTPDLRLRARQVPEQYAQLLRDYREMRVVFHEQLATELRYAGCSQRALVGGDPAPSGTAVAPQDASHDEPEDASAWPADGPAAPTAPAPSTPPASAARPIAAPPGADTGKAVWIEIDNRRCARPGRLAIDGVALGEIPPGAQVPVRTRAGTRSLCLLPADDPRPCGERGTLRSTFLYEGLLLSVHCPP